MGLRIKHVYPKSNEYVVIHRSKRPLWTSSSGEMSWIEIGVITLLLLLLVGSCN